MSETTANGKSRGLIGDWERSVIRREHAELQLTDARNSERAASKALADWIAPKDAKAGESFGIWDRDIHGNEALFNVRFSSVSDPEIEKRYR